MALRDIKIRRETLEVEAEGGTATLTLYGLDGNALAFLAQEHGPVLASFYANAVQGNLNMANVGEVMLTVVNEAPLLAASVIAFGCREPEEMEAAMQLPAGAQFEALEKIFRLTFASEAQLKKVSEIVGSVMAGLSGLRPAAPSTSGTAASESASAS